MVFWRGRGEEGRSWVDWSWAAGKSPEHGLQRGHRVGGDTREIWDAGSHLMLGNLGSLGYWDIWEGMQQLSHLLAVSWTPPPSLNYSPIRQLVLAGGIAPLPASFTYVNDNPQEVIVGECRELASLDLLNHFITGTSFEWPSSAG